MQVDGKTKLKTLREIKKGELIVLAPCIANNVNILVNTGFTIENNPHDVVDINIAVSEGEAHFALKLELLEVPGNKFTFQLRNDFRHPQSMEIFSFLRFIKYDQEEGYLLLTKNQALDYKKNLFLKRGGPEDKWDPKGMFFGTEMNFCTRRCERLAIQELGRLCLSSLARYPTTLQQDLEVLEKDSDENHLATNERNCIRIRAGEKQILNKWLNLSQ